MRSFFFRRLLRNSLGVLGCTLVFATFGAIIDMARLITSSGSLRSPEAFPSWSAFGVSSLAGAVCGMAAVACMQWNENRAE